jgi:hypothetical protein
MNSDSVIAKTFSFEVLMVTILDFDGSREMKGRDEAGSVLYVLYIIDHLTAVCIYKSNVICFNGSTLRGMLWSVIKSLHLYSLMFW